MSNEVRALPVIHLLRIHIVLSQPLDCHVLPHGPGLAVVAVRVDGDAAARRELAPDFDVFGIHELDEVFHDDVDTVLVEVPVIAE